MKMLKRAAAFLLATVALVVAAVLLVSNPEALNLEEVAQLTRQLNEAAAIGVPHDFLMRAEMRSANETLLQKVESGEVLSADESATYRKVYQTVLMENQRFLGAFDAELTVLQDHATHTPNNVAGEGIVGRHDHHDVSARKNFAELLKALQSVETATTSFGRIRHANTAQKQLVDLISHIGVMPHTVSVPYTPPDVTWSDDELGAKFEAMMLAFKEAQFADVNGPEYWVAVERGLASYNDLILSMQTRIASQTMVWERKVAGRFLAIQTLPPPVNLNRAIRKH